ncbi:hypothetical protein [Campylobacter sp. 7477a]|uniref:hypothetical protein n=1 Tax=Campylobacter sp. 7477a TaxID=2735741 RepID=UPI003014A4C8|nr:hypothetical protein [Campylobacter sp. 7477a]
MQIDQKMLSAFLYISGEVENLKANEISGVNSDRNLDGSQENQESDSDKKVEGAQENQNLGDDEASTDSQALKDGDKEKKGGAANKTKAGAVGKNKS